MLVFVLLSSSLAEEALEDRLQRQIRQALRDGEFLDDLDGLGGAEGLNWDRAAFEASS